ncbi:MAG: hypothetical protein V4515_14505 [Chloroflexota bacterium]
MTQAMTESGESGMTDWSHTIGERVRVSYTGTVTGYDARTITLAVSEHEEIALAADETHEIEILPPVEPPMGTVVMGWTSEARQDVATVWQRMGERDASDRHRWQCMGEREWFTWENVLADTKYGRKIIEP